MSSRERVLEFLVKNKDEYLSGEDIAKELGISRNAIWKAINDLREAGYIIDAVKNKGYSLSSTNDIIFLQDIKNYLKLEQAPEISVFNTIDSTSLYAKKLAIDSAKHGTTIVSGHQTEGKAHDNKVFWSPTGGLYLSIILYPQMLSFSPNNISKLSAALVCHTLSKLSDSSFVIKNATDIYNGNEKVAGILNEAIFDFETSDIQWIVSGIGFPKKITANRNQLVAAIIDAFLTFAGTDADIDNLYEQYHA